MRQTASLAILLASGLFSTTAIGAPHVRSTHKRSPEITSILELRLADPDPRVSTADTALFTRALDSLLHVFLPRAPQDIEPEPTPAEEEPAPAEEEPAPAEEEPTPAEEEPAPSDGGLSIGGVKARDEQRPTKPLMLRTSLVEARQFTNETDPVNGTDTEPVLKRDTKSADLFSRQDTNGTNPGNDTECEPVLKRDTETMDLFSRQDTNGTNPGNETETESVLKRATRSMARTAVLLNRQVTNGTNGTDAVARR
ncbi:hypothetical protein QBC37DRAFT_107161 [Rhypophila decipiens]|uniref:Uncharacterized protein n=1 Tax=Rhypophila decipiens TaxID=261697 RepID=A0AAN6XUN6_9PEZI|nr:hypothetical protein QBC37DRAFT_107161 [Rhypophila decipiens]